MFQSRRRNLDWVGLNMSEVELDKLIPHFAQSNKAEGKSPRTIAWYSDMLNDFARFLESKGCKGVLSEFDIEAVREFVVYEQERGVSPYTVQGKVRALKAFSSWLFREAYMSDNVLSNFKLPRVPTNLIEPLTSAEIGQLMDRQNPLTATGFAVSASRVTLTGALQSAPIISL